MPVRQFCRRGVIGSEQPLDAVRFAQDVRSRSPFVAGGVIDGGMASGANIKDFLGAVPVFHPPWCLQGAPQLETKGRAGQLRDKPSSRAVRGGRRQPLVCDGIENLRELPVGDGKGLEQVIGEDASAGQLDPRLLIRSVIVDFRDGILFPGVGWIVIDPGIGGEYRSGEDAVAVGVTGRPRSAAI